MDTTGTTGRQETLDSSYNARNAQSTEHLEALVSSLSSDELALPLYDGWTVAALLAHLAMLDRLRLAGWKLWESSPQGADINWFSMPEIDLINEAAKQALLAVPAPEAARQAISAAREIDSKIAALDPARVADFVTGSELHRRMLDRSIHRNMHIQDIERALGKQ